MTKHKRLGLLLILLMSTHPITAQAADDHDFYESSSCHPNLLRKLLIGGWVVSIVSHFNMFTKFIEHRKEHDLFTNILLKNSRLMNPSDFVDVSLNNQSLPQRSIDQLLSLDLSEDVKEQRDLAYANSHRTQAFQKNHKYTIMIVHHGSQEYVKQAIEQVFIHAADVDFDLVLIGHDLNIDDERVIHVAAQSLTDSHILEFRKNYVHRSPNPIEYERFCLERWLLISNYLEKNHIETPVLALDSDFLMTDKLTHLLKQSRGHEFAATIHKNSHGIRSVLPHYSYFKDKRIVKSLKTYILNLYKQESDELEKQLKEIGSMHHHHLLVSDMYLLGSFLEQNFKDKLSDLYSFAGPFHGKQMIISNVLSTVTALSIKNGKVILPSFKNHDKEYKDLKIAGIHFQGYSKKFVTLILQSIRASMQGTDISCATQKNLYNPQVKLELYCSKNSKDIHNSSQIHQEYFGATDEVLEDISIAQEVPKVYFEQLDPKRFQFISLPSVSDSSAFIASGNFGAVYLVYDAYEHQLKVAKFIKDGIDKKKQEKAMRILKYEKNLAQIWYDKVKNPLKIEKINSVILKTYVHGNTLHQLLLSGFIYNGTNRSKLMRSKLMDLFHKMFDQKLVISDLNTSNLIYNLKSWVIVDGDNVIEHEHIEDLFEEFRHSVYLNKKYFDSSHEVLANKTAVHKYQQELSRLKEEVITAYQKKH